jgi:GT2 family glycosyltransferase
LDAIEGDKNVHIIRNTENKGYAKACNQGIDISIGEFVLLLNNDIVLQDDALSFMVFIMGQEKNIDIAGPCLLYPNSEIIQHAGVIIGNDNGFIAPYHRGHYDNINRLPEYKQNHAITAVTGACMMIKRDAIDKIGLLDEYFVNGFEDIDYCLKAKEKGLKVWYIGEAILSHYESVSSGRHDREIDNWLLLKNKWQHKDIYDEPRYVTLRSMYMRDQRKRQYEQK